MSDFVPHRVVWTREKSSRFWDQLSHSAGAEESYFSAAVGGSIIGYARSAGVDLKGRVLDFGSGPGHLVMQLLAEGVHAEGADFSALSVEQLRKKAAGSPNFGGATLIESLPSRLESDAFSTVFFVETIEHLLDDDLSRSISELRRIIRPGGFVVVTTPNAEDLQLADTVCPDCGAMFHRVQHVRSWTAKSITACMSQFGFDPVSVKPLYPDKQWWKSRLITLGARILRKNLPRLFYVGRKAA